MRIACRQTSAQCCKLDDLSDYLEDVGAILYIYGFVLEFKFLLSIDACVFYRNVVPAKCAKFAVSS